MNEQNENQAIEEIATIIAGTERVALDVVGAPPSANMLAKAVYFAGYRKQIEGEWLTVHTPVYKPFHYKCSVCGFETFNRTKHCPNCGAKMKGGTEQ